MKTIVKSMMLIGMMVLGSVTTYGKTTISVSLNGPHISAHVTTKAKECRLRHVHDKTCGGPLVDINKAPGKCPLNDKKLEKHLRKGDHNFAKNDICKKCHMTRAEIRRMEHGRVHERPITYPMPRPRR